MILQKYKFKEYLISDECLFNIQLKTIKLVVEHINDKTLIQSCITKWRSIKPPYVKKNRRIH